MRLQTAQRILASERAAPRKKEKRSVRARTIAAIHTTWKKLRRDLHDPAESREQRITFMAGVLNKTQLGSSRDLTDRQLGKCLDAMRALERAPELPGVQVIHAGAGETPAVPGEVVHLATAAQVATIEKLLDHLGWGTDAREGYVEKRFKRKSPRLLSPQSAGGLMIQLLTIAASRSIRDRGVQRVSRGMIREEIPRLKRALGIDQKPVSDVSEEEGWDG